MGSIVKMLNLLFLYFLLYITPGVSSNSIHGGTYLAMAGKESVILASDSRFSSQSSFLLGKHPRCVFRIGSKVIVGCFGLDSDARILIRNLRKKLADHLENELEPEHIARLISNILYSNNVILSPIVVGIRSNGEPYICSMDGLGAQTESSQFAVTGTANAGLYALCESLYSPNLSATELMSTAERCFKLALQRDVMSGCDIRMFSILNENIYMKDLYFADA